MIPNNAIENMYAKIIGENSLLMMAQNNLLNNLERIEKIRTHTFISNNGQTEFGISRNYGSQRFYSWEDTVINCRHSPNLIESEILQTLEETIAQHSRFLLFKSDLENRMHDLINIQPFYSILEGKENMRYNIRCASKIEDFDIIRVGIVLSASCDDDFRQATDQLQRWENPFAVRCV